MNTTEINDDPYPFEDFAPTLSQCFVIVIVGYLMARFELLNSSDLKGVNAFAAYFAMPGIICLSLMDANFDDFRWELLFGIFLGKLFTFIVVSSLLLLIDENLGVAGTVGIFCVQSNDLPVGNPLMSSLYRNYRPQMMKYLFLIPAMTIILFAPISNVMISIHRIQRKSNGRVECLSPNKSFWQHIQSRENRNHFRVLVKNPVVIATLLGLILNAVFRGQVPTVLHQPIKVAAATIPGIALALLGFSFIRKERYLISSAIVPALGLLGLKMIVTPILFHVILKMMTEDSESSKLLSDFSLLYGIISPATVVFQSGQEFRKSLSVMSVALILTSFCCFPASYIVARFTIAPVHKLSTYVALLKNVLFWTAGASIFSDIMVWIKMLWKRQKGRKSCYYVGYLVFTQSLASCGVLLWGFTENETWAIYSQMALFYSGEISGYLWTGTLGVILVFQEKHPMLLEKGFSILSFAAFSVSAFITTVMCLIKSQNDQKNVYIVGRTSTNFEFLQLVTTSILLSTSLTVVLVCTIFHFKRRNIKETTNIQGYENRVFYIQEENVDDCYKKELPISEKIATKLEESEEAKFYHHEELKNYGCDRNASSEDRKWTNQLRYLMLIQGLVMLVRLIANIFKLTGSKALEIMIPMEFLQSVLFTGQGIFLLFIFGIDIRTMTISVRKWWRKIRVGTDAVPNLVNIDPDGEEAQFCRQFYAFYFNRCFMDIAKERRWKEAVYRNSFWGHQLVDWMISEGLCSDDTEAEAAGQRLLAGGILKHVAGRHHFHDAPYLYCFMDRKTYATK